MKELEAAIHFIMDFYEVTYSDAVRYFWDEIEAYMMLMHRDFDKN